MKRREFIVLVGGAAAAWPFTGRAQRASKIVRIGYPDLSSGPSPAVEGFQTGLRDLGYVEGQNLVLLYRGPQEERIGSLLSRPSCLN
jgi:putative tryptophan/tyrosine transport system substrate-binding protein